MLECQVKLTTGDMTMDWNYVALIAFATTLLLLMIQRTEPKRRRLAGILVALALLVIRHNAFLKGNLHYETLLAFVIALLLSALFWLLIGRYNPVQSVSEVRVVGMDD